MEKFKNISASKVEAMLNDLNSLPLGVEGYNNKFLYILTETFGEYIYDEYFYPMMYHKRHRDIMYISNSLPSGLELHEAAKYMQSNLYIDNDELIMAYHIYTDVYVMIPFDFAAKAVRLNTVISGIYPSSPQYNEELVKYLAWEYWQDNEILPIFELLTAGGNYDLQLVNRTELVEAPRPENFKDLSNLRFMPTNLDTKISVHTTYFGYLIHIQLDGTLHLEIRINK